MKMFLLGAAAIGALLLIPIANAHPLEIGAGGVVVGYVDPNPTHLIFEGEVPEDGFHVYLEDNGCPDLQRDEDEAAAAGCVLPDTKVA